MILVYQANFDNSIKLVKVTDKNHKPKPFKIPGLSQNFFNYLLENIFIKSEQFFEKTRFFMFA